LEAATSLLERWNTSLESHEHLNVEQEYHLKIASFSCTPSPELIQVKEFLERWIQMTKERCEGLQEISLQYQHCLQDHQARYQQALHSLPDTDTDTREGGSKFSPSSCVAELYRHDSHKRIMFEQILQLKTALHGLQETLKSDKRLTFQPIFRLPEEISLPLNSFLSVFNILSLIPNSIVLLFAEEKGHHPHQSSYAGILPFDKLSKIMKVWGSSAASAGGGAEGDGNLLWDLKKFLENLHTAATAWSVESKKLLPVATRAGIKRAAVQYTFQDIKKVLDDPITQYLEPPGYHELNDIFISVLECERELLSILIPEGNQEEEEEEREGQGEGEGGEEDQTQLVTSIDLCRLNERWNSLRDRIQQLPIQLERFSFLIKWFSDLFEWFKAIPEQVFDLLQLPEMTSNQFNIANNSKKLNFIDKEKSKFLLELGNSFLSQGEKNEGVTNFFRELNTLYAPLLGASSEGGEKKEEQEKKGRSEKRKRKKVLEGGDEDARAAGTTGAAEDESSSKEISILSKEKNFFHFKKKVNPMIRFTLRIHEYLAMCYQETMKYETLARGILEKISNTTNAENLDKNIELLKKLVMRCDELFILPDGLLRINMKNLLKQLEASLWDGITLFNENKKEAASSSAAFASSSAAAAEDYAESTQWIPTLLNNPMTVGSTSEELLSTAISYFEDEEDEFIDAASLLPGDEDDEYEEEEEYTQHANAKKKRRTNRSTRRSESNDSLGRLKGRKSSSSSGAGARVTTLDEDDEVVVVQNCILDDCEWPRMKNSFYCSESCAVKGSSHLFNALVNYKPTLCHQVVTRIEELDKVSKLEHVLEAVGQGNLTSESLVNDYKMYGIRTTEIMLNSLSQHSIDYLFPSLPAIGTSLSASLRKQVRSELQNTILSSLSRLHIPCAFGNAVIIATDIEKSMAHNVTTEDAVRIYRKKYMLLSKALKDPFNDTKIQKILFHEMSIEEFLKLDSTEFDDDEKQQRRLESINAEKKKLVPAGKSLTELLEEKRRAAEEGVEAWRDGTAMDQSTVPKQAVTTNTSKLPKGLPTQTPGPVPATAVPKKKLPEVKIDTKIKEPETKTESRQQQVSPRVQPSPKPSPKQIAPTITSLLQMGAATTNRPKVESVPKQDKSPIKSQSNGFDTPVELQPSSIGSEFYGFTDVRVSTPLGPPSAHVPQLSNPEDGPLKVLLTNQNDSEFLIHITNYPVMRETVSLVCTGGIMDCTGQGVLISGIQNDKRYQVDALRKQLRNFKKHIPISILVLSVKEDRELTERKYRYICNMFSDPEKERIPSVEFHGISGDQEHIYNLHMVVPQLVHYFPQLNTIVQKSTSVLPNGFWLYGILEMDRDVQGPEPLVRCNQIDFPVENIRFLMGKVDKLVNTIESMPQPDVNLAIERVQQTVGNQFDFLNPGHKDFQFFINQVNQQLREKKLKEWGQDNEKKRKHDQEKLDRGKEKSKSIERNKSDPVRSSHHDNHKKEHSKQQRVETPRERGVGPPVISRRSSHDDQPSPREPQLLRSWSDDSPKDSRNGGHNDSAPSRKSRFS
jgi:hypothetical protein